MEKKNNPLYIVVGVIAAVLVIGGIALIPMGGDKSGAPSGSPAATSGSSDAPPVEVHEPGRGEADAQAEESAQFLRSLAKRNAQDPAAIGDVDAPVVMIEWSDFRCPFCSAFNETTLPKLQRYVDDGSLRIEFRDLAVFGEDSVYAAVAARAAGDQGRYIEFMDAIFAALPNEGHPPVDEALVLKIAEQVEVADLEKFKADLSSEELRMAVQAESFEAQQLGLSSVPAFVIGGEFVAGAQPIEVFEQIIEAELAKATR